MEPTSLFDEVIKLGKQCVVSITGWPEDAEDIVDADIALTVIKECIRLGQESHNKLNQLLYEKDFDKIPSKRRNRRQGKESARAVASGTFVLNQRQFEHFYGCMMKPEEPSQELRQGAELLEQLQLDYKPKSDLD